MGSPGRCRVEVCRLPLRSTGASEPLRVRIGRGGGRCRGGGLARRTASEPATRRSRPVVPARWRREGNGVRRSSGWVVPRASRWRGPAACAVRAVASHASDPLPPRVVAGHRRRGVARRHGPSSTCTSTPSMPRCCAQHTPATATVAGRRPSTAAAAPRCGPWCAPARRWPSRAASSRPARRRTSSPRSRRATWSPTRSRNSPGTTMRAGKPCSAGSGSPFMADGDERVAPVGRPRRSGCSQTSRRPSARAAARRPGRRPARASRSRRRHAEPTRVAGVRPADLVRHAGEGEVALDHGHREQLVVADRERASRTMPPTVSVQAAGSTLGTVSAVSTR